MNMQEIGYILFMEEQEKKLHEEVNVDLEQLSMEEMRTNEQKERQNNYFS